MGRSVINVKNVEIFNFVFGHKHELLDAAAALIL